MLQLIFMSRRTAGYSRSSRSNKVLLGRKAYQGQSGYPGLVGEIGSLKTTGPTSSSATVPDLILASFNSTQMEINYCYTFLLPTPLAILPTPTSILYRYPLATISFLIVSATFSNPSNLILQQVYGKQVFTQPALRKGLPPAGPSVLSQWSRHLPCSL